MKMSIIDTCTLMYLPAMMCLCLYMYVWCVCLCACMNVLGYVFCDNTDALSLSKLIHNMTCFMFRD